MSDSMDLQRRIVQSKLLDETELEQVIAALPAGAAESDQSLLDYLVGERRLTEFQAGALAAGFTGPFMLGPYRVHEKIAASRFGDLFRAVHFDFNQSVSLKVFPAALTRDPTLLARMQREVRVAVQLDHPHVIRSFQIGRVGELYFLALEDLAGETLADRLARLGRLPYPEACRLLRHAALGLECLHIAEVAHRDLRPANLWINQSEQLKIMEFGAARDALSFLDQLDDGAGVLGEFAEHGDARYLAPEAAADPAAADDRSDVYALGCTLYHALAGEPPFTHTDPAELLHSHATEVPRIVSWHAVDVPQPLAEMVARSLAKTPDERPTVGELDWALERYVDDLQLGIAPSAAWSPEYLAWAQEANLPVDVGPVGEASSGISDELSEFLDWLATNKSPARA